MLRPEQVRDRLASIERRLARLRSEKDRLVARAGETERRWETRRKIVLGAAVLAAIERDGVPQLQANDDLIRWLDEHLDRPGDRVVFDLPPRRTA